MTISRFWIGADRVGRIRTLPGTQLTAIRYLRGLQARHQADPQTEAAADDRLAVFTVRDEVELRLEAEGSSM